MYVWPEAEQQEVLPAFRQFACVCELLNLHVRVGCGFIFFPHATHAATRMHTVLRVCIVHVGIFTKFTS